MKKEVTILKTWKWEQEYKIDMNIEEYLGMKVWILKEGGDGFFSKKYNEFLKFARFESEKWKTDHIYLEWPKEKEEEKKRKEELTPEQKVQMKKNIAKAMERSKERRYRDFIEEKKNILNRLADQEKHFWVETTVDKLKEYDKLKRLQAKNITS